MGGGWPAAGAAGGSPPQANLAAANRPNLHPTNYPTRPTSRRQRQRWPLLNDALAACLSLSRDAF
eukprot:962425-Prymnesium_polylepis.1